MKEEPQQLRPLYCEYDDDNGDVTTAPSKIVTEKAEENRTKDDTSLEQPLPANGIKEELALCQERNQSDCSINPLTDCSINPLTEQIQGTDTPPPIMGCSLNNSGTDNYVSDGIKEEEASCQGGNQSDCSINPFTEQTQGADAPVSINECSLNSSLANNFVSDSLIEESDSCGRENQSDCSINQFTEQTERTVTPAPIMGCSLYDSFIANYISNAIKEVSASWEGRNQSDCSINPLTEQIQGTYAPASIMGCSLDFCPSEMMCRESSQLIYTSKIRTSTLPAIYTCAVCHKGFSRKKNLVRHERIHTGINTFSCPECGKCFAQKAHLIVHHRTHTGEKPFTCPDCGKCFRQNSQLNAHQRIHKGEKPFACSECGKRFTLRSHLIVHQRTHTGEKPFCCSECGKCFSDKSQLNVHVQRHTGKKPFACSECGKCFTARASLNAHQKIHFGGKPFSCPECGKCFTLRSQLNLHLKTHTGEKPFPCLDCGKRFTRPSNLASHRRVHH